MLSIEWLNCHSRARGNPFKMDPPRARGRRTTHMKNSPGYALFSCLILIGFLMALSLVVLEQVKMQQRLLSMNIAADQKEWHIKNVIQHVIEHMDFNHCRVPWLAAVNVDQLLLNDRAIAYCFLREDAVDVRYVVINSPKEEPHILMLVARIDAKDPWSKFQMNI